MINFFKKEKEPENIEGIIKKYKELEERFNKITKELNALKEEKKFFVKKIKIVRYNPFSGVGGNQSFSIALLDNGNNGIVITSLYARDGNRVYAKPIKDGKSEYQLSDEEEKIINQAIKEDNQ